MSRSRRHANVYTYYKSRHGSDSWNKRAHNHRCRVRARGALVHDEWFEASFDYPSSNQLDWGRDAWRWNVSRYPQYYERLIPPSSRYWHVYGK